MKTRLGAPDDLAACHTAEVADYVIEGHVPAAALKRFLAERPDANGLAVPDSDDWVLVDREIEVAPDREVDVE